jgi:peroxidase
VFELLLIVIICFGSLYKENRLVNSSLNLRNHFNNPSIVEEPGYLDALIRGLATQSSQKLDLRFAEDVSQDR